MKLSSATILIILATVIWGATPAIMKLTLQEVPTFTLAFIRMAAASAILSFLVFKNLKIKKQDLKTIVLAGLSGVTFNISLFFLGLKLAPAINAALLVASVPIITLFAANIYLKEKFSAKLLAASAVAAGGVFFIVGLPSATNLTQFIGNILLLFSALAWVFYEIVSKKLFKSYSASTITFWAMAIGAFSFLPFAAYEQFTSSGWIENVTIVGLLGILFGIFFASLTAYWAWQKGLSQMPAGRAAFFFYLDPISGAIFAVILLGEKIIPQLIVGGLLITMAVILAEYHRKNHPLHKLNNS